MKIIQTTHMVITFWSFHTKKSFYLKDKYLHFLGWIETGPSFSSNCYSSKSSKFIWHFYLNLVHAHRSFIFHHFYYLKVFNRCLFYYWITYLSLSRIFEVQNQTTFNCNRSLKKYWAELILVQMLAKLPRIFIIFKNFSFINRVLPFF